MEPDWIRSHGLPAAVLGDPLDHTLSPPIHNAAFRQADLPHRYHALRVSSDRFESVLRSLVDLRFLGLNFTVPHKEAVLPMIDRRRPEVETLGAANTLYWEEGEPVLANTDVYGFRKLVEQWTRRIRTGRVLVLGAGGAARACVVALHEMGAGRIYLWNRTDSRATRLRRDLGEPEVELLRDPIWPLSEGPGLVVNATSLGLSPDDPSPYPAEEIRSDLAGVDLNYGHRTTFLDEFEARGEAGRDGLTMLLHQAARAWELWTGREPDLDSMDEAARQFLDADS